MPTDITIAFAGHAANEKSNIKALVTDFLRLAAPDADGYYEKPDRWGKIVFYLLAADDKLPAGLKNALDLALSIEGCKVYIVTGANPSPEIKMYGEYVDKILAFQDPLTELVDILSDAPRPYLFMNWDEEHADDEAVINRAHEHQEIRVSDLVMGLTAILPDVPDAEEEEEEPEPEPVKEEKPSTRRRKAEREAPQELEEDEEDLEEEPRPSKPEPVKKPEAAAPATLEQEVSAAQHATTQSAIAIGNVSVPAEVLRDVLNALTQAEFYMSAIDAANAVKNLADGVKFSPLTQELTKQMETLNAFLQAEEPYEKTLPESEKPKPKPSGKTTKVIWDEDAQEWKKAGRGRPRAGARTGVMDAEGNVTED